MQPRTGRAVLVTVIALAGASPACSFDERPRAALEAGSDRRGAVMSPAGPTSGSGAPVDPPPAPATAGQSASVPPVAAGASGGAGSAGGPAGGAGMPAPVAPEPDASAPSPPNDPPLDAGGDAAEPADAGSIADASAGGEPDAAQADAAREGGPFSPCLGQTDCEAGQFCRPIAWSSGSTAGYCTAFCGTVSGGQPCPQPRSGSVAAHCQPATGVCELGSCERLQCPDALRCVRVETPIGGGQVLSTYTCQP